jgi:hypothetical protein
LGKKNETRRNKEGARGKRYQPEQVVSAMRVRYAREGAVESPSLVLLQQPSAPAFRVSQDETSVVLATAKMKVVFDRHDEVYR